MFNTGLVVLNLTLHAIELPPFLRSHHSAGGLDGSDNRDPVAPCWTRSTTTQPSAAWSWGTTTNAGGQGVAGYVSQRLLLEADVPVLAVKDEG